MALLLDTHTFLWWIDDSPRLTKRARAAIAAAGEVCFVSVASWWEMAIKISLERIRLAAPLDRFLAEQMAVNAFRALPLRIPHVARLTRLPFHHRDPFDRLLAAQALEEDLSLVSADRIFRSYGVQRVW